MGKESCSSIGVLLVGQYYIYRAQKVEEINQLYGTQFKAVM